MHAYIYIYIYIQYTHEYTNTYRHTHHTSSNGHTYTATHIPRPHLPTNFPAGGKAENNPGLEFGTKNNENVGGLIGSKATEHSLPLLQEPEYSPPHRKESPRDEPLGL